MKSAALVLGLLTWTTISLAGMPQKYLSPDDFKKRADALLSSSEGKKYGHHSLTVATESEVLYGWQSDRKVKPASNLKLLTTLLALDELGPDFTFKTGIQIEDAGDRLKVYLKGSGDPSWATGFVTPDGNKNFAAAFLESIRQRVSLKVRTKSKPIELIIDDQSFVGSSIGPWTEDTMARCYSAGIGAFNFEFNCDEVTLHPPKSTAASPKFFEEWAPGYFDITDRTQWRRRRRLMNQNFRWVQPRWLTNEEELRPLQPSVQSIDVDFSRQAGSNEVIFVGENLPVGAAPVGFRISVDSPTEYFAKTLKTHLEQYGFAVTGWHRGTFPVVEKAESISMTELSTLVYMLNKVSLNLIAESLFRELSLKVFGQSSYEESRAVAKKLISEKLQISDHNFNIVDGSGLSHQNQITTLILIQGFQYSLKQPWAAVFTNSLPIAGVDGSLAPRMKSGCYLDNRYRADSTACGLRANVRAKTGSIDNVITLTGMMKNNQGKQILFSFSSQDFEDSFDNRSHIRTVLHEQILAELYRTEF